LVLAPAGCGISGSELLVLDRVARAPSVVTYSHAFLVAMALAWLDDHDGSPPDLLALPSAA